MRLKAGANLEMGFRYSEVATSGEYRKSEGDIIRAIQVSLNAGRERGRRGQNSTSSLSCRILSWVKIAACSLLAQNTTKMPSISQRTFAYHQLCSWIASIAEDENE